MGSLSPGTSFRPAAWSSATRPSAPAPVAGAPDVRPRPTSRLCVDCLLCWLYCPDSAVRLDGTTFAGFDLDYCKGCELCADVCPTSAIAMVRR